MYTFSKTKAVEGGINTTLEIIFFNVFPIKYNYAKDYRTKGKKMNRISYASLSRGGYRIFHGGGAEFDASEKIRVAANLRPKRAKKILAPL